MTKQSFRKTQGQNACRATGNTARDTQKCTLSQPVSMGQCFNCEIAGLEGKGSRCQTEAPGQSRYLQSKPKELPAEMEAGMHAAVVLCVSLGTVQHLFSHTPEGLVPQLLKKRVPSRSAYENRPTLGSGWTPKAYHAWKQMSRLVGSIQLEGIIIAS